MRNQMKIALLVVLAIVCIGLFLFYDLGNWDYTLAETNQKSRCHCADGGSDCVFDHDLSNDYEQPNPDAEHFGPRFSLHADSDWHYLFVRFCEYGHHE